MYHAACLTLRQQNFSLLKMTFGLTIKRHHETLYSQRTDNYRTILNKKIETSETLMKGVKPRLGEELWGSYGEVRRGVKELRS